MKFVSIFLVLVCGVYFAGLRVSELRRFSEYPSDLLESELRRITEVTAEVDETMLASGDEFGAMERMEGEARWIELELKRRRYSVGTWMPWVGILGVLGLLFPFFTRILRGKEMQKRADEFVEDIDIPEATPGEEYVDEFAFRRRIEGAFKTRDEAIAWMIQDPLLKCDYCGSELRSTFEGNREALQLVTFYKKVPEGAKDLRIVLGSYWYAKSASELKCVSCQRMVQR